MNKFIARVDGDLRDLIPVFLARKLADTRAILSGIGNEQIDFEALSRIGHKLKGEGGSYGLDEISLYGSEIERAAHNRDAVSIRHYADELSLYLESVQIEYE
jgi:HPt (histidine-containing phosphotransfer) domain-containing protein